MNNKKEYDSREEWEAEGRKYFGEDVLNWTFKCPVCGHVASVKDYVDLGASPGMVGFSCIGRLMDNPKKAFGEKNDKDGPCDYAGGGLFLLNPIKICLDKENDKYINCFEFAKKAKND